MSTQNKGSIRNLIIFVLAINIIGWMAYFFAQGGGTPESQGLGMLLWLVAPFLVSILLRLFTKDWQDIGVKPNLNGNGKWYALSILIYPLIVAIVLLIGLLFGGISVTDFSTGLFIQAMTMGLISNFIKNIFEEFAWRGYLTPKMNSTGIKPIAGHLLAGFVWGTWHIPYWLGLLDSATFDSFSTQSLAVFVPMAILGITASGILFGEIRLITGSTWPALIMHTINNAVIAVVLTEGFFKVKRQTGILFTPGMEGILSIALITLAGLWLYQQRIKRANV
ncbi:MAG: CPBP family intramembrane metalloprotease [Chloroflexi bacterium]|nr:CPBP family intramembrane metalloprotease [Chloroflexota bacterium]